MKKIIFTCVFFALCLHMTTARGTDWCSSSLNSAETEQSQNYNIVKRPQRCYRCSSGWRPHEDSCYRVFGFSYSHWDAEDYCRRQGGHLASIHSSSDDNFIRSLWISSGHYYVWLGMHRVNKCWEWTDGSAVEFTKWHTGEPNNGDSCRICLILAVYTGGARGWNDDYCRRGFPFICQKPCH